MIVTRMMRRMMRRMMMRLSMLGDFVDDNQLDPHSNRRHMYDA